jgi:hypothetical protein
MVLLNYITSALQGGNMRHQDDRLKKQLSIAVLLLLYVGVMFILSRFIG